MRRRCFSRGLSSSDEDKYTRPGPAHFPVSLPVFLGRPPASLLQERALCSALSDRPDGVGARGGPESQGAGLEPSTSLSVTAGQTVRLQVERWAQGPWTLVAVGVQGLAPREDGSGHTPAARQTCRPPETRTTRRT